MIRSEGELDESSDEEDTSSDTDCNISNIVNYIHYI